MIDNKRDPEPKRAAMAWSTRVKCLFACAATYVLAAHRFWPMGAVTAIVPSIVVWLVTKRLLEQTRVIDSVVEDYVRRSGGDF